MKKLVLASLAVASITLLAGNASACERSYGGGVSANCHREYQQSRQYYRELDNQRYHEARRDSGYGGQGYYVPNYGFDRLFYGSYYAPNRVKEKTARRGGEWFQDCGEEIGVVPIGKPCSSYRR